MYNELSSSSGIRGASCFRYFEQEHPEEPRAWIGQALAVNGTAVAQVTASAKDSLLFPPGRKDSLKKQPKSLQYPKIQFKNFTKYLSFYFYIVFDLHNFILLYFRRPTDASRCITHFPLC